MLRPNNMQTLADRVISHVKSPVIFERRVEEGFYQDGVLKGIRESHYTVKEIIGGTYMPTRNDQPIGHFSTLGGAKAEIRNQVLAHGIKDLMYKTEQDFK